ncbi:MAG: tRNA (adenosine(37)-N6)-dimethylallyltransferase MiaA [Spirochaetaceae bacterium]|jgi:tRNA dimethylallyltransferase|nr:tRNA (adenosine(37)-N6)-dimethylallyltransferase MiaA [Spirochaetaceae bacterium]
MSTMAGGVDPVLILFGPTASGKTELLQRLFTGADALCKVEVISADSAQVYRGLDIGSAKPGAAVRAQLPHHLIDMCTPDEQFTAGDFVRCAGEAVRQIRQRGRLPVISGGTGFYINNFIYGLPDTPPADNAIRAELKVELNKLGSEVLHAELARVDPVSAARIHQHDSYRLLRALEVFRLAGRPLSSFKSFSVEERSVRAGVLSIGIERPRGELYARINKRCAAMMSAGLYEEVSALAAAGYTPRHPALRAIGYKEFFIQDDEGAYHLLNDRAAIEGLIAQNSRRYAKRQLTYFKTVKNTEWFCIEEDSARSQRAFTEIASRIKRFAETCHAL